MNCQEVENSVDLICLTTIQKIQFTIIYDQEEQQILTFEKKIEANVLHFGD